MSSNERQRVQKVPGARRAKLTPAAGTDAETLPADDPADAVEPASGAGGAGAAFGPNDERMRRDVPPHY